MRPGCRHQAWDTETMQICILEWQNGHKGGQGDPGGPLPFSTVEGRNPPFSYLCSTRAGYPWSWALWKASAMLPPSAGYGGRSVGIEGAFILCPGGWGASVWMETPGLSYLNEETSGKLRVWHNSTTQSPRALLREASRPMALRHLNAANL